VARPQRGHGRDRPYNGKIPAEAVEKARKGIVDGSLHPFAGPSNDQKGMQMVPTGETIPDSDLLAMDWYVEGVASPPSRRRLGEPCPAT
jgi:simple sugar transport system substrate-binding protein